MASAPAKSWLARPEDGPISLQAPASLRFDLFTSLTSSSEWAAFPGEGWTEGG